MGSSVVARDGDVNELEVGVGVAEGDDGDVHVTGLDDGLSIGVGVDDDQESWLLELLGLVVSEDTRSPSGVRGSLAAGGLGELDNSTLSEVSGRDGEHVLKIGDTSDDSGGETKLVIHGVELEHGDSVHSVRDVSLHLGVHVVGADVAARLHKSQVVLFSTGEGLGHYICTVSL